MLRLRLTSAVAVSVVLLGAAVGGVVLWAPRRWRRKKRRLVVRLGRQCGARGLCMQHLPWPVP